MVLVVINNLIFFTILFVLFLTIFSIMTYFVMNNKNLGFIYNADDGGSERLPGLNHIFLNNFLLTLGMGFNDETTFGLFLLIFICYLFIIVLLNILIAVVGYYFEQVWD